MATLSTTDAAVASTFLTAPCESEPAFLVTGTIQARSELLHRPDRPPLFVCRVQVCEAFVRPQGMGLAGADDTDPADTSPLFFAMVPVVSLHPAAAAQHSKWQPGARVVLGRLRRFQWPLLAGVMAPCLVFGLGSLGTFHPAATGLPDPSPLVDLVPALRPYAQPPNQRYAVTTLSVAGSIAIPPPLPSALPCRGTIHQIIDFKGTITRVFDLGLGLFQLDNKYILCATGWPAYHPDGPLGVGRRVRLRDVHMASFNRRLGFYRTLTGVSTLMPMLDGSDSPPRDGQAYPLLTTSATGVLWICPSTRVEPCRNESAPAMESPTRSATYPVLCRALLPPPYRFNLGTFDLLALVDTLWLLDRLQFPTDESDRALTTALGWLLRDIRDRAKVVTVDRQIRDRPPDVVSDVLLHDQPDTILPTGAYPCARAQQLYPNMPPIVLPRDILDWAAHVRDRVWQLATAPDSPRLTSSASDHLTTPPRSDPTQTLLLLHRQLGGGSEVLWGRIMAHEAHPLSIGADLFLTDDSGARLPVTLVVDPDCPAPYAPVVALTQLWAFTLFDLVWERVTVPPHPHSSPTPSLDSASTGLFVTDEGYVRISARVHLAGATCLWRPGPALIPINSTTPSASPSDMFNTSDDEEEESRVIFVPTYVHHPQLDPLPSSCDLLRAWAEGYCFPVSLGAGTEPTAELRSPLFAKFNLGIQSDAATFATSDMRDNTAYLLVYATAEDSGLTRAARGIHDINPTTTLRGLEPVTLVAGTDLTPPDTAAWAAEEHKLERPESDSAGSNVWPLRLHLDPASAACFATAYYSHISAVLLPPITVAEALQMLPPPSSLATLAAVEPTPQLCTVAGRIVAHAVYPRTALDHVIQLPSIVHPSLRPADATLASLMVGPLGLGGTDLIVDLTLSDPKGPDQLRVILDLREWVCPPGLLIAEYLTLERVPVRRSSSGVAYATLAACSRLRPIPRAPSVPPALIYPLYRQDQKGHLFELQITSTPRSIPSERYPAPALPRQSGQPDITAAPRRLLAELERLARPPPSTEPGPIYRIQAVVTQLLQLTLQLLCVECRAVWAPDHVCYAAPNPGAVVTATTASAAIATRDELQVWMKVHVSDVAGEAFVTITDMAAMASLLGWNGSRLAQLRTWLHTVARLDYQRTSPAVGSAARPQNGVQSSTLEGAQVDSTDPVAVAAAYTDLCNSFNASFIRGSLVIPETSAQAQLHDLYLDFSTANGVPTGKLSSGSAETVAADPRLLLQAPAGTQGGLTWVTTRKNSYRCLHVSPANSQVECQALITQLAKR
ncbi:hypothetical protein IWQ60_006691 [Tieghemiomyces parasiticus]|uniref:CST complex subunit CTC1 n=1 Tax=Tieghemiomyces parasiticus TaxID=78921 RepID=A0A9W8A3F5_9FUNG|nr:hypothetical protein IWQ60_006691 [Tieghemiomyces parasiticus]